MANDDDELPHLLRCRGCGVPNGHNAERCWSCDAELSAASRKRVAPSLAPGRGDVSAVRPRANGRCDDGTVRSAAQGRRRSLSASTAIALALAALAAFWTPQGDRSVQAGSVRAAAVEPLQAGAPRRDAEPTERADRRASAAPERAAAPAMDARHAARVLGLADDAASAEPAVGACRDVDRALALCAAQPVAAETR